VELLFLSVQFSATLFGGPPPIVDIIPNSFCIFNKNFHTKKDKRLATKRHKEINHELTQIGTIFFDTDFADYAEGFGRHAFFGKPFFTKHASSKGHCLVREVLRPSFFKPSKISFAKGE
jgi:hypothetical protein